ncbi:hypothetical protein AB2L27_11215 [Kineococcus sp. LSe6-4]|uniref:DUF4352 domain-containing protein n=1 Tax=Kineococcus halophytocola TaxID=3234027 RepID=A0ABV4H186_9ACTN
MKLRTPLPTSGDRTRGWTRPVRRSALAVLTSAAVLGVAGCSVFSPPTVLKPYAPSDGSQTRVGGVEVRNVLLVSTGVDQPGVLSAVLVNSGDQIADVSVSVDVEAGTPTTQSYTLAENAALHIGDPEAVSQDAASTAGAESANDQRVAWLQVPQVPVVPGQTVPVSFTVGGEEASVNAQVLLPCFEYATLTPTAAPAAGADAETGTGTGTATAATPSPTITCGPALGEEGLLSDEGEGEE